MQHLIRVILVTFFVAGYTAASEDIGNDAIPALMEAEDYDNSEDTWFPMKRFWSPHPSDYNPLRRPVPVPRSLKRDDGVFFHPVPRIIGNRVLSQRSIGRPIHLEEEYPEAAEDVILEGGRQKKQTRPTTLIFRLGSWGLRGGGKKGDKNGNKRRSGA